MKTIIRSIDRESHERATALTLALIKGEMHSRTGLDKKKVRNPCYTEDFDNGLLFCEYYQRADLGEKTWHGIMTDLRTDTVFCFEASTLAEVRFRCVRVVKNRFEAGESKTSLKRQVVEFRSWKRLACLYRDELTNETPLTSRILDKLITLGTSARREIIPAQWYLSKWLETKAEFSVSEEDGSIKISSWK